jgi:TolB-like protein/class 3 adenylate cyclase
MTASRKLAAILAADVVGYSRLTAADEEGTLARLREVLGDLVDPAIERRGGRVVKRMGDGVIAEFRSAVEAARCAIAIQTGMAESNRDVPGDRRIVFRIGVHVGDVVEEADGDLMGDGVNIAARLEGVCEPGGVCLSGAAYEQVRDRLDRACVELGDKMLKNIARPVRTYAIDLAVPPRAAEGSGPPRLSLIVLPFANIGGGPEQDYFADGVTESLTTDLSRIHSAFVIARNTAFVYKNKPIDARQIGKDLGVRYLLEGSVQRSADRMRVNVQLIEAETGAHLWAERFDKPLAELFDMQDEIVSRIANEFSSRIVSAEARRAEKATDPDCLDFWFRGLDWLNRGVNPQYLTKARECFERARDIDPHSVNAMVGLALVDAASVPMGSPDRNVGRLASAQELTLRALSAEPGNALGHFCLGLILLFCNRAAEGISHLEQALTIDRNLAIAHAQIGFAKVVLGRADETQAHVMEAMRLSPRDVVAYVWFDFAGVAKAMLGQTDEALSWLRKSIEVNPNYPIAHFHLAAALALCGQLDDAAREVDAGLALAPNFTTKRYRDAALSDNPTYQSQRERILDGMLRAGVPEG